MPLIRHAVRALTLSLLATCGSHVALADVLLGPQSDAATLREARGSLHGAELRLDFELRRDQEAPAPVTLRIGAEYLDVVEQGRETLYDFRLRRRLVLDRAAHSFANIALYSDIAFRRFDMEKRVMLAQMMSRATADDASIPALKPFWIESDVGVASGATPRPEVKKEDAADGAVRFRSDGEEVAFFVPSSDRLSLREGQAFARFLRYRLPVHPEIVGAIEEDGRLPQRLVFVSVSGQDRHVGGLVLRRAERAESDYPLPADYSPLPITSAAQDSDSVSLRQLLPLMLDAVTKHRQAPPLSTYRRSVEDALQRRDGFEAALLLAEMTLQYGRSVGDCPGGAEDAPCHTPAELSKRLGEDPRAAALYRAQALGAKNIEEALAIWRGLDREKEPHGYIVDLFIADLESAANHRPQAVAAFETVLRRNPSLGALYKDLGDHFLRGGRVDLAWICYDLGRSLPQRSGGSSLGVVDALEHSLATQYPDFF